MTSLRSHFWVCTLG